MRGGDNKTSLLYRACRVMGPDVGIDPGGYRFFRDRDIKL